MREPGSDDDVDARPLIERIEEQHGPWQVPLRPLAPKDPNGYLAWLWHFSGSKRMPPSAAVWALDIGIPFTEAQSILRSLARRARREQVAHLRAEREGVVLVRELPAGTPLRGGDAEVEPPPQAPPEPDEESIL